MDQRPVEQRNDVLSTLAGSEAELEVTGPIQMVLYASTTATDTDFTAKLVDVFSVGRGAQSHRRHFYAFDIGMAWIRPT